VSATRLRPTRCRRGPWLALGVVASAAMVACGGAASTTSTTRRAPSERPPAARAETSAVVTPTAIEISPSPALAGALDRHCRACHSGAPGRVSFVGRVRRDVLYRAAIMVAAGRMPPPPRSLSDGERDALAHAFCDDAGSRAECPLAPAGSDAPLIASPEELVRLAYTKVPTDGGVHRPGPDATFAEMSLYDYTASDVRVMRLDPTIVAIGAALANERCPAPVAGDAGAYASCVRSLLDPPEARIPSVGGGAP